MSTTKFFTSKEQYLRFRSAWANAVTSPKAKHTFEPYDEYRYDIPKGTIIEGWKPYGTNGYAHVSKGTGKYRKSGWIKAEHTILYNILRGKPLHTGFTPIRNPNKLGMYEGEMNTFYIAVNILKNRVEWAKEIIADRDVIKKLKKDHTFLTAIDKLRLFLHESKNDELLENDTGFVSLVEKMRGHIKRKPKGLLSASSKKYKEERLSEFLLPFDGAITIKTLAKLDDDTDNVLSPLDDMMDRHYERLDNYDPAGH